MTEFNPRIFGSTAKMCRSLSDLLSEMLLHEPKLERKNQMQMAAGHLGQADFWLRELAGEMPDERP